MLSARWRQFCLTLNVLTFHLPGIGDIAVPSTSSGASAAAAAPTPAELRAKRLAFLERVEAGECSNSTSNSLMTNSEDHDVEEDEEEEERETRPKATKLPSESQRRLGNMWC